MKFLIAGGGTGGHVFPGIALAQALKKQNTRTQILFVGTEQGLESTAVPKAGFTLQTIEISGLKAKSLPQIARALWLLPWAVFESIQILRAFRPQVVVGVGGYVSGPVLLAAWILRIPRAICEQNSIPGFTNRLLGRFLVTPIFGAFQKTAVYFPKNRFYLTGNPLRAEFKPILEQDKAPKNTLLILGGSLGARPLNDLLPEVLATLQKRIPELQITHQTGSKDTRNVQEAYTQLGVKAQVLSFIEDMPKVYREARLVIARAGATTCSELCAMGVPSILIPFPQATDDHQTENARELLEAGAAILLPQSEMSATRLTGLIEHLLLDLKILETMANKARQLGRLNAADVMAQKVIELC